MAKRQAAESSVHGICFFTLSVGSQAFIIYTSEFPSYLLQYGNKDLSFTLQIFRPKTAAHLKPEQVVTRSISHGR